VLTLVFVMDCDNLVAAVFGSMMTMLIGTKMVSAVSAKRVSSFHLLSSTNIEFNLIKTIKHHLHISSWGLPRFDKFGKHEITFRTGYNREVELRRKI